MYAVLLIGPGERLNCCAQWDANRLVRCCVFLNFLHPPPRLFSVICRHTIKHIILCLWQTEQCMQNAEQDFFLLYHVPFYVCFSRRKQGSSRPSPGSGSSALLQRLLEAALPAAAQHASSSFQRNQRSPQKLHLAVDVVPP